MPSETNFIPVSQRLKLRQRESLKDKETISCSNSDPNIARQVHGAGPKGQHYG
jgi:hypothetical protein